MSSLPSPTVELVEGHRDRLRRPPYHVAVVGPARIDPGFVVAKVATLLARKLCTHRVEVAVELDKNDAADAVADWLRGLQLPGPSLVPRCWWTYGRYADARQAVDLLSHANGLILFDDGTRNYRFHIWLADRLGVRVATVRVGMAG